MNGFERPEGRKRLSGNWQVISAGNLSEFLVPIVAAVVCQL
jgi:hypothetical protein